MRKRRIAWCAPALGALGASIVAVALVFLLGPDATASAQQGQSGPTWLSDRSRVEGRGIRAGRLELHPGIGVELGYDTNVFLSSGQSEGPEVDSFILRVSPHLYLATMGEERRGDAARRRPQQVRFRGGVSMSYYEYFSLPEQRNLSADLSLRLDLFPEGTWQVSMFEDFSRGVRPFTNSAEDLSYARDRNRVGFEVGFAPNGDILEYRLGYAFGADIFEESGFDAYNNLTHEVFLRGRWRFLPKTAFSYEGIITVRGYMDPVAALTDRADSVTLGTRVGLLGLVSTRVSINLSVGYIAGFYQGTSGNDLENVSAQAEITWAYTDTGRLRLGYLRDSQNSYFGNFIHRDQGSLSWQQMIAGRLLLGLEGSGALVRYDDTVYAPDPRDPDATVPVTDRSDILLRAVFSAEYRVVHWLGFTLSAGYTANITDFAYFLPGAGAGESLPDPGEYNKIEAWLGVRAAF